MPRPVWSGSISFGLVNVPVKLYGAIESHRVAFHEFEEGTGQRIHHKRVSERSGREVPWDKIRKGFEVAKGRFVVLTDEELEAAEPEKTRTIDIEQFVKLEEIDPASWDQTYYVGPDGASAHKAYALLRQAMYDKGRVAIGRFVMRTKEYVVCIRPLENALALQTMYFPDEVRSPKIVGDLPGKAAVKARELTMAGQLIDSLTSKWDPSRYEDTHTKKVMALVRKKDQGKEIVVPEAEEAEGGKVVDLMEALKATLARHSNGHAKASRGKPRPAHAPRAASGGRSKSTAHAR
ncbi:MAG TPA: Ku protein [Polyangia bacterium]|jgi:DNA end-binding protein Ku|nr:Ku protein [Polyangia bacterium]